MTRLLLAASLLLGLVACAGTAAEAGSAPRAPNAPAWTRSPPFPRTVVGIGIADQPSGAPDRILRDLADADACERARASFAQRAAAELRRSKDAPQDSLEARARRLRASILRTSFHGCRIDRRECVEGKASRLWCWSRAVLDTSETMPALVRELGPRRAAELVDSLDRGASLERTF